MGKRGRKKGFRKGVRVSNAVDRSAAILTLAMQAHFPGISDPINLSCEKCQDYAFSVCQGEGLKGWACVRCMAAKGEEVLCL